jgi:branched-chain amino acid aminotransferase
LPAKVHLDGRVQDLEEARIPVTDHGFLFGDSVFETLRALGGRCAFASAHLARLRRSADACRLSVPWSDGELRDAMELTLAAASEEDAAVRLVVSRGSGPLQPDPSECTEPRLVILARARPALAEDAASAGVRVVVSRAAVSAPGVHAKTGNYLASVLALAEARDVSAFEAVLLNSEGRVTECASSNVFAVIDGRVLTPPSAEGLLPGIARGNVLELCAALGIEAAEEELWPEELRGADEAFLTSTLKEVVPVSALDDSPIGSSPGPVTLRLQAAYRERLRRETSA